MDTKKLIIILAIIIAVVVLLIVFVPKAKASTGNAGSGVSGSGGSTSGMGNGGGPSAGTRNYDASTFNSGDLMYATKDFYAVCTDCILPNWLCLLHDCYSWNAGQAFGNFVSLDGSTITFSNGGYTYTVLLGDAKPYVIK